MLPGWLEYYSVGNSRSRVANRIHILDEGSVTERGYGVLARRHANSPNVMGIFTGHLCFPAGLGLGYVTVMWFFGKILVD